MELKELSEMVCDECRRIERNNKMKRDVREAFETAPDFDDIPISLKNEVERGNCFYEGPEVTIPADEFTL